MASYPTTTCLDASKLPNWQAASALINNFIPGPNPSALANAGNTVTGSWVTPPYDLRRTYGISAQLSTAQSGSATALAGTWHVDVSDDPGLNAQAPGFVPGQNWLLMSSSQGGPQGGIYNWTTLTSFDQAVTGSSSSLAFNQSSFDYAFCRFRFTYGSGAGGQVLTTCGKGWL